MCAKCKLQLGQHLADNQAQHKAQASSGIYQQCHHFNKTRFPVKTVTQTLFLSRNLIQKN